MTLGSLEVRILPHYDADELMKGPERSLPVQPGGLKQSGVYSCDAGGMLSGSAGLSILYPPPAAGGCRTAAPRHPPPHGAHRLLEGAKPSFFLTPSCFAQENSYSAHPRSLVASLSLV